MARRQGVRCLKFKYRKSEDWLPVCIDQEMDVDSDEESDQDKDYHLLSILSGPKSLPSRSDQVKELVAP